MTGELLRVSDDGPARCSICGAEAVGPCARCKKPTCGDCCVLTEGGAHTFAICVRCDARGGRTILPLYLVVLSWVLLPCLLLLGLMGLLYVATR